MSNNLNQGQVAANDKFMQFLFTPAKGFIISGPAGTGKTHLMNHFIDHAIPSYMETCKLMSIKPEFDNVEMTATTNKAAEVLSQACKRPTGTIHSFLNLRVSEDWTNGKTTLSKTSSWRIHEKRIIFVDEASMVDTALFKYAQEGTKDCKFVFVGDHNQLAPVFEKLSPVFQQGYDMAVLTEQMRNNKQPALMDLCQQLRETVETGVFKPIKLVPGVIDLLDGPEMLEQLQTTFAVSNPDTRVLAFTNRRVREFNGEIRNIRGLPDEFQQGEEVICNSPFRMPNGMGMSAEEDITIERVHGTETVDVAKDTPFKFMNVDLVNKLGYRLTGMKIPADVDYYHELIKYFSRNKQWDKYFNLKNTYPDLRMRDAATTHKSQGSTYESVFIDVGDISNCTDNDQVARMLYVAASRARTRIYLYGDLKERFGGVIK